MIVHTEYEQGSEAWLRARAAIPTASELHNLVTPKGKVKTGDGPKSYLATKLAERWLGGPLPGFSTWATEQGSLREAEAIPWYSFETGIAVQRVGLCTTDDGLVGCSPDGLIGEDNGLELKCPEPKNHVKYLLEGVVPDDYIVQVQAALWVTQRPRWTFLSYCPKFPALIVSVEPDEVIQQAITDALARFLAYLEDGWQALCNLNGGPPPPKPPPTTDRPKFSWECDQNDVPT